MYFVKEWRNGNPPRSQRLDLQQHIDRFDFIRDVYPGKLQEYGDLSTSNPSLIADIAGAVVTTFSRQVLLQGIVVKHALSFCRNIIQDSGFILANPDRVRASLFGNDGAQNVVMVAGCQDETMLERRVEAAVDVVCKFEKNFTVVFSGRNPVPDGATPVRIRNESEFMDLRFRELIAQRRRSLPKLHYSQFEPESSTTDTNVAKFFENKFVERPSNIVVVSSTFHLVRLGRSLLSFLSKSEYTRNVCNVVLVGAESERRKLQPEDAEYLKLMMFDVFDYVLRTSPIRYRVLGPPADQVAPADSSPLQAVGIGAPRVPSPEVVKPTDDI